MENCRKRAYRWDHLSHYQTQKSIASGAYDPGWHADQWSTQSAATGCRWSQAPAPGTEKRQKLWGRLHSAEDCRPAEKYIDYKAIKPDELIFPISYGAARIIVLTAGQLAGIKLRPHDLRRHAATYASRSGVPIEIVSKVILRHANLSTTQRYLGKVSDVEAIRWIENVYGWKT